MRAVGKLCLVYDLPLLPMSNQADLHIRETCVTLGDSITSWPLGYRKELQQCCHDISAGRMVCTDLSKSGANTHDGLKALEQVRQTDDSSRHLSRYMLGMCAPHVKLSPKTPLTPENSVCKLELYT